MTNTLEETPLQLRSTAHFSSTTQRSVHGYARVAARCIYIYTYLYRYTVPLPPFRSDSSHLASRMSCALLSSLFSTSWISLFLTVPYIAQVFYLPCSSELSSLCSMLSRMPPIENPKRTPKITTRLQWATEAQGASRPAGEGRRVQ